MASVNVYVPGLNLVKLTSPVFSSDVAVCNSLVSEFTRLNRAPLNASWLLFTFFNTRSVVGTFVTFRNTRGRKGKVHLAV